MSATGAWTEIVSQSASAAVAALYATDGAAHPLLPCIIIFYLPSAQVVMEIDDVFWISSYGGVASEDRIIDGSVYRVFQNCARLTYDSYLAIKEG